MEHCTEPPVTSRLLTVADVARRLTIDQRTVRFYAQTGQLPAFKIGDLWRFDAREIARWLTRQRYQPFDVSEDRRRRTR